MKLLSDYHTHSKYSRFGHGKNTIEEMVYRANELGLEELAITDHGLKNFFGTNKEKLKRARVIIDDINTWSKTKILLGIEADILNTNGDLDIDDDVLDLIDVLCAGYHPAIKTDFAGFFGGQKKTQTAIDRATSAYINAIKKYPINFITHIDSVLKTDLYKIGCACYERDVAIEINDRHVKWTQKQVDELLKSKCMFIVNSDAHSVEEIGRADFAFKTIKKFGIPAFNLVNVEFDEHEMSEDDKEMDLFYGIFKEKQEVNNKKIEEYEKKKETEFTNTLSKEMEDALRDIAIEKGISYNVQKNETNIQTKEEIIDDVAYYMQEMDRRKNGYTYKKSRFSNEEEIEQEEEQEVSYEDDVGSSDFFSSVYGNNNMEKFTAELERDINSSSELNRTAGKIGGYSSYNDDYDSQYESQSYQNDEYNPSDEPVIEVEREQFDNEDEEDKVAPYKSQRVEINRINNDDKKSFAGSQSFYSVKKNPDDIELEMAKKATYEPNKNLLNEVNFSELKDERPKSKYNDFSEETLRKFSGNYQKDSSYSNYNSAQESQFEYLKNNKREKHEASNVDVSDFFDDSIDSSSFNVNDRGGSYHSQGAYSQNDAIEINRNYSQPKSHTSSGINKGTFIGLSGNISNQKPKQEKEEPAPEVPKKKPGLSNGLVDFSSLTSDDEE